jgi:hypothetical protein
MNPARLIATGAATTLLLLPTPSCTTDHPSHPHRQSPHPTPISTNPQSRAEAFAHQYFAIFDNAVHTKSSAKLQPIAGPDCVVCKQEIDFINQFATAGQSTDFTSTKIHETQLVTSATNTVAALVTVDVPAYKITNPGGTIVKSEPAYRVQFQMGFRFADDRITSVYLMDTLARNPL